MFALALVFLLFGHLLGVKIARLKMDKVKKKNIVLAFCKRSV